jgi:6-methylsalicylate decarboxylase
MSAPHRIDVHQHVLPPFYVEALSAHGGDPSGSATPKWSPEIAIDFMDSQHIATGMLSLSTPSVVGWNGSARREMARRVNEFTAELVRKQPNRFGTFATLPLPDVDGALRELEYAMDSLRVDGVVLMANYVGKYLGDPMFEPLWAELHRRETVVLVHPGSAPGQPPLPSADGVASPLVDFPFETTRTAVQLVLNGVVERYPAARIILAHAGGFVPYAALRFAELTPHFRPEVANPKKTLALLQHFYFDTALASGPAMPTLKSFAGPGRILFGSDFPYAPANIAAAFTSALDADPTLTPDDLEAINHRNASVLFPRLAPQHVGSRS